MNIQEFTFNLFQEKTRILWKDADKAVIVDPGFCDEQEKKEFYDFLDKQSLIPCAILLTHAHADHIFGVWELQQKYAIPVYMNPEDEMTFHMSELMSGRMGFPPIRTDWKTTPLDEDGMTLSVGGFCFRVILTPGHSPGSVCYYEQSEEILLSGDTLFAGTIGRTDLEGSDYDKEILSIMEKLTVLPPQTRVLPGHGPQSTIGIERCSNPFLEPFNEKDEMTI